jgi:hypothetical protein
VAYTSGALGLHEVLDGSIVGTRGTAGPEFRAVPVRAAVSGFTGAEMDCTRKGKRALEVILEYFTEKKSRSMFQSSGRVFALSHTCNWRNIAGPA